MKNFHFDLLKDPFAKRQLKQKLLAAGIIGLFLVVAIAAVGSAVSKSQSGSAKDTSSQQTSATSKCSSLVQYSSGCGGITLDGSSAQQQSSPTPAMPTVYTGTGDDVLNVQKPTEGPVILTFSCPGCQENTIVKVNGADSLLVNTIGSYNGSHLIDDISGSSTSQATITATGSWTLTLSGLDKATPVDGQAVSGQGDSVLEVTGNSGAARFTNAGYGNFIVKVYPETGGDIGLPVNTIGSYSGTVPLAAPAYVQIISDGTWSITPN